MLRYIFVVFALVGIYNSLVYAEDVAGSTSVSSAGLANTNSNTQTSTPVATTNTSTAPARTASTAVAPPSTTPATPTAPVRLRTDRENTTITQDKTTSQRLEEIELQVIYSRADSNLREKRYNEAYGGFVAYVTRSPNDINAYTKLGEAATMIGNYKVAEEAYLRAIDLNPSVKSLYIALSNVYLTDNRNEQAIATYIALYKKYPRDQDVRLGLANTYLTIGSYKEAIAILTIIVLDYAGNAPDYVYNIRGSAYYYNLEYAKAVQDYTTAIEKKQLPSYYYNRSLVYSDMGRIKEARADVETYTTLMAKVR